MASNNNGGEESCCSRYFCGTRAKCKKTTGIGLATFGLLLLLFGIFFSHYILLEFQHQLHHSLRLQTPEEDQKLYNQWQNDYDPGASPEHWTYNFFNVTNVYDVVQNGADPEVVECGPYVYREFKTRYNVSFTDGNNIVAYNQQSDYAFETGLSCPTCKEDDIIYGLWPTYITLIKMAGSVTNAEGLIVSPLANLTLSSLEKAAAATNACQDEASCRKLAIGQWFRAEGIGTLIPANTSMVSSQAFLDLLPSLGLEIFRDVLEQLALRNTKPEFAFAGTKAPTFTVQQAYDWTYNASANNYACALASSESPDPDPTVGCATFFLESFLAQTTAKYFPEIADSALPLALYFLSLGQATLPSLCDLAGAVDSDKGAGCAWRGGIMKNWLFQLDDPFLRFQIAGTVGVDPGKGALAVNTGYFANANASTIGEAWIESKDITTTSTGKKDLSKIDAEVGFESHVGWLPKFQPSNNTGYFCAGRSRVYGSADHQPFTPGSAGWFSWKESFNKDDTTMVWVDNLLRPINLQYRNEYKYRGISVWRFELADDEFTKKPQFDTFIPGVLNMTCVNHGTPIQLTLPHYAKAVFNDSWRVEGVTPPIPDEHYSFLDIDPITGSTLIGHERIQINLLVNPEWISANPGNMTKKLVPALWVEDSAHMSDKQEHEYKTSVIGTLTFHEDFLIATLTCGSVVLVSGAVLWYFGYRASKQEDDKFTYQSLDDPNEDMNREDSLNA